MNAGDASALSSAALIAIADSNYYSRCATMIESAGAAQVSTVLTMDEGFEKLEDSFARLQIESWNGFLNQRPEIAEALSGRSPSEQIFSVGPSFLLTKSSSVIPEGWLIYADSDLFFFESVHHYLRLLPECNVVIVPHRHYAWNRRRLEKYGHYNVGLVAFRNNEQGLRALQFWADSCLDWCYDRPENGKYADQKYLEQFSSVASGVYVDNSLGANLAPWNSLFQRISVSKSGEILVGKDKLVYFHAQGLRQKNGRWILGHLNYLSFAGPRLRKHVYKPYLEKLEEWAQKPGFEGFGTSRAPTTLLGKFATSVSYALSLLTGQTIKVLSRRSGAQS